MDLALLTASINKGSESTKHTLLYTVAYWVMWKTVETIGDQLLPFGDGMNQPIVVRNNKLGALCNNEFSATDYDPRWAGDNWQLVVAACDGAYTKFYIGHSSNDESGVPEAAKAEEPTPGRAVTEVRTRMDGNCVVKMLDTSSRGAGWLAQAWIWPRDLSQEEVRELWMLTKSRYPVAKRGIISQSLHRRLSQYRPPPNPFSGDLAGGQPVPAEKKPEDPAVSSGALVRQPTKRLPPVRDHQRQAGGRIMASKLVAAKVIEKDTEAMLEVPLVNKLAFQRLLNVFSVLVDYAIYSNSYIVVDRVQNFSPTAELMLELALRKNPTSTPVVLYVDSKARLEKANHKLKELKRAKFLRKSCSTTSIDFLNASIRQLVTPQGITWLRASASELANLTEQLERRADPEKALDAQHVRDVYELYGDEGELNRDGRPNQNLIWKSFYAAQLFASATHYIVFDHFEHKGRSPISTLGTIGAVFLSGASREHRQIVDHIQAGLPMLLLESTGGVTQAFAHVMKAVRLMKPKWTADFVLRIVTEYKVRAARTANQEEKVKHKLNQKFHVENIILLDKELARIDLLLSSEEHAESWMRAFGLPEVLMLFESWQRAPDFLLRQISMADVMKKSAEELLDVFTASFSGNAGGVPELGLGNAETKVVATAWNRHLLLFHNGDKYNARSWIMQLMLYLLAIATTSLAIFSTTLPSFGSDKMAKAIMLILPILSALLGTVGTRLRQRQKYAGCKMGSYEIVSEIYKFRVRGGEYDPLALAMTLQQMQNGGGDKKKKEDEEPPKPISGKELAKFARSMFVSRVRDIYTTTMQTELSTGTSISHTTKYGMDPARLLRDYDTAGDEDEKITKRMLQSHVAEKLYYIKSLEWEKGAEGYKAAVARNARRRRAAIIASVKANAFNAVMLVAGCFVGILANLEVRLLRIKHRYEQMQAAKRGESTEEAKDRFRIKYAEGASEGDGDGNKPVVGGNESGLQKLYKRFKTRGRIDLEAGVETDSKPEMLDETYRVPDEDDEEPQDDMEAGGGGRPGDNLFGPLSIDDYMTYRAKPACTYLERTAPWRAFELQLLEILVFVINSMGAILVGLGETWVPYVTLTVAIAAVARSFIDFAHLEKQVEAYNAALRDVHNMMNDWDGKTRTERRTRQTIAQVVGTVELALQGVYMAITDGSPTSAAKDGEEGEGEKEDDDK